VPDTAERTTLFPRATRGGVTRVDEPSDAAGLERLRSSAPFIGDSVYVIDGARCDASNTSGCGQTPATVTLNPAALVVLIATVFFAIDVTLQRLPKGLSVVACVVLAVAAAAYGLVRRGVMRILGLTVAVLLLAGAVMLIFVEHDPRDDVLVVAAFWRRLRPRARRSAPACSGRTRNAPFTAYSSTTRCRGVGRLSASGGPRRRANAISSRSSSGRATTLSSSSATP